MVIVMETLKDKGAWEMYECRRGSWASWMRDEGGGVAMDEEWVGKDGGGGSCVTGGWKRCW